jgi:LEA14-like dessication related protein
MNKKGHVVYGLGLFIALFLLSSFIIELVSLNKIDIKSTVRQDAYAVQSQLLQMSIKDINVSKTGENTTAVKIILGVHNPQTYTILLDGIDYSIHSNNITVSSGEIGSEALLDVMREEPEYPIISNDTVTLKDAQIIHTNEIKNNVTNIITAGEACYMVNGTYFFREAANLSSSGGANEFQTTFPNNCK